MKKIINFFKYIIKVIFGLFGEFISSKAKVVKKIETKQVNKYPFITLKRAYFKKYYPELLPVAKTPKGKTMEDILKSRGL